MEKTLRNEAEMGVLLGNEGVRIREVGGGRLWEGEEKGSTSGGGNVRGVLRGHLASGKRPEAVKSAGGRITAGSPPASVCGWKSAPLGCFLAGLGVFNINSNDCGGKIIGLSQIRRG